MSRRSESLESLAGEARRAMETAYAPYSHFPVGAVLEARDGRLFRGCNVENAAYPVGLCAERAALASAVAAGARRFRRLVVATAAETPTPPCGMCRQALSEFGDEIEITAVTQGGESARWRLEALLPDSFRSSSLGRGAGELRDEAEGV